MTHDESVAPPEYNYRTRRNLSNGRRSLISCQASHRPECLLRINDDLFHPYSTYARGCEGLTDAYSLLDRTPYGRQEDFEDSPPGWPQKPTYG